MPPASPGCGVESQREAHTTSLEILKGPATGLWPIPATVTNSQVDIGTSQEIHSSVPLENRKGPWTWLQPHHRNRPACPRTQTEMLLFTRLQMLKGPDKTAKKTEQTRHGGRAEASNVALVPETCLWRPADQSPIFQLFSLQSPAWQYLHFTQKGPRGSKPIYTTREETNTRFLSCVLQCEQLGETSEEKQLHWREQRRKKNTDKKGKKFKDRK